MKIKSKSHAMELLRDLESQGFIEHSWITTPTIGTKTRARKVWLWKTKTQDGKT